MTMWVTGATVKGFKRGKQVTVWEKNTQTVVGTAMAPERTTTTAPATAAVSAMTPLAPIEIPTKTK
jgi:hypothetical protein